MNVCLCHRLSKVTLTFKNICEINYRIYLAHPLGAVRDQPLSNTSQLDKGNVKALNFETGVKTKLLRFFQILLLSLVFHLHLS